MHWGGSVLACVARLLYAVQTGASNVNRACYLALLRRSRLRTELDTGHCSGQRSKRAKAIVAEFIIPPLMPGPHFYLFSDLMPCGGHSLGVWSQMSSLNKFGVGGLMASSGYDALSAIFT